MTNNKVKFKTNKTYIFFVLFFTIIATLMIVASFAATPSSSVEIENGSIQGNSAICNDLSASGSKSIIFGINSCITDSRKYTNPVKTASPDPGIFKWDNKYYMVYTTGDPTFWIFVSDDLVNWQWTYSTVFNGSHPWGKEKFWAPEIHHVGNKFVVYYTASNGSKLMIGAATSDSVTGPYSDIGAPLISETFGVIDANLFVDDNGRQYLYWKEDEGNTRIFAQEIDQSGIKLIGPRTVVLEKGLSWEGSKGIEAPWVIKKNGFYYMFYSGELYSSSAYAIGVSRSLTPMGLFSKKGDPILISGSKWKGPGHNSVVTAGNNDFIVYHAWNTTAGVGERDALVDKITWLNNWPTINNGVPGETEQFYPQ